MQVLFRGPEANECQRDLYGPLPQWLGLEGETRYAMAYYRLTPHVPPLGEGLDASKVQAAQLARIAHLETRRNG